MGEGRDRDRGVRRNETGKRDRGPGYTDACLNTVYNRLFKIYFGFVNLWLYQSLLFVNPWVYFSIPDKINSSVS